MKNNALDQASRTRALWLCTTIVLLALITLSWHVRAPLPPSAGYIEIPQSDVDTLFEHNRQRLQHKTLSRVWRQMEPAWEATLPDDCGTHLPRATRLANEFPTLLSAWRVLWSCADLSDERMHLMRRWISQLLNHIEQSGMDAARYRERGLPVHNFTDALAYVDLRGYGVLDAWYETYAKGQQLRIGVLLWDGDASEERTLYFTPRSTISAYTALFDNDETCRVRVADCTLKAGDLTSYTSPAAIGLALAEYEDEQHLAAMQKLYNQSDVSLQAALLLSHWLLVNPVADNSDEILSEVIDVTVTHNSAQGKLLKALAVEHNLTDAGEHDTKTLYREAQEELSATDFAYWQAYYLTAVDPDPEKLIPRFRAAAEAGSPDAMAILANEFAEDPQHSEAYLSWLIRAANLNHRQAMHTLGHHFYEGTLVERSLEKSYYWLRQAADLGYLEALNTISYIAFTSGSEAPEFKQVMLSATRDGAHLGSAAALNNLGLYATTEESSIAPEQMFHYFRLSAEQGNINAQLGLATCYETGQGTDIDPSKAIFWLRHAAAQGSAAAHHRIAFQYSTGNLLPQNEAMAFFHYHQAASAGHTVSQWQLARYYENGTGVIANDEKALHWYQQAADNGDPDSYQDLGWLYEIGAPGQTDFTRARQLYRQSAEAGNPLAWNSLALLYDTGRGVNPDAQQAVELIYRGDRTTDSIQPYLQRLEHSGEDLVTHTLKHVDLLAQTFHSTQTEQRRGELAYRIYETLDEIKHRPGIIQKQMYWLQRGTTLNHPQSLYQRGLQLSENGTSLNTGACNHFQRAHTAGSPNTYILNAVCSLNDKGNISRGQRLAIYRQAFEQDIPDSQRLLADLLFESYDSDPKAPEVREALQIYEQLAERGDAGAAARLGAYLEFNYPDQYTARMLRYYRQAAKQGNPLAQNNLGRFLMSTNLPSANPEQGWRWAYIAHLQGSQAATDTLGEAFEYGWTGAPDWRKAVNYYLQAGQAGNALSYHNAARLLSRGGYGLEANLDRSQQYASRARDMGYQGGDLLTTSAALNTTPDS